MLVRSVISELWIICEAKDRLESWENLIQINEASVIELDECDKK